MKERALFATKIGVIAATVGSAVGLGNFWRFPYEAGTHGGGAFLLVYLGCVLLIGIPVMCAEFIIGRGTHKNISGALKQLLPGTKYYRFSFIGIAASILILSFYSVVAGWTMEYALQALLGNLSTSDSTEYSERFNQFCSSNWRPLMWTLIFLFINAMIILRGVQKGIERISNILLPLLFLMLVAFAVNSLTLPGAADGLRFLFSPDFSQITPSVILGAMGQAFFSLSLGLSCLLVYSSYFSDSTKLVRSASIIAVLDTVVAVMSGVVIFPAVFSFGAEPSQGPKLVFEVLPSIFAMMPGGYLWAVLLFVLLFFASITSSISMSEISIAYFTEEFSMSRTRATCTLTAIAVVLGACCALSFGMLSDFKIAGMTVFDLFDFVSSNVLLPIGGFIFSIYVGWILDRKMVKNQLTNDGKIKVYSYRLIIFSMRWVAPIAILLIFLCGLHIL